MALNYIATLDHYGLPGLRNPYIIALSFSVSVMAIIGTHELGHKIAATYHGVKATMPYFIPFPNILGTLGAVIRVKSPSADQKRRHRPRSQRADSRLCSRRASDGARPKALRTGTCEPGAINGGRYLLRNQPALRGPPKAGT
ncbi:site-2 protease family protein [Thermococcus peptonophilus]|uniref:site-2 protease family protein n=1 Tax=Thermococcus peptonophilus TaxID=53952 RepID=UPI000A685F9C